MNRQWKAVRNGIYVICLGCLLSVFFGATLSAHTLRAEDDGKDRSEGTEANRPGVYFFGFEPSFYTGFAPRCQDPRRVYTVLGRGNQLRVTVVMSDSMIEDYLLDLAMRYRTYRELIETGQIYLSQNRSFERFERVIYDQGILSLAARKDVLDEETYREISLEMLQKLNPGRVFHIRMDFEKRLREWSAQLAEVDSAKLSKESSVDVLNDMLPTRLKVSVLSPEIKEKLREVIEIYERYEMNQDRGSWHRFYDAAADLFTSLTEGIYPLRDRLLDFYEFTAIYPVGTLNQFAKCEGEDIPLYPCPGKRVLKVHQRTGIVDHIPNAVNYSYLPWIPYMHVGKRLHNSFHSLWFAIETRSNSFIPKDWKCNTEDSRTGEPYPHLWLLSRGPMSHGCTHVNAGHISELRQLLPSSEEALAEVVTFRNKFDHFDVFDIDGDGQPEVMGVKYFYAYSLKNKKPHKMRVSADRKAFYEWLYKKGFYYDAQDRLIFEKATSSKFIGNRAVEGEIYHEIPLYEDDYSLEAIQFYETKDIRFVRELRRVSSTYHIDRHVLRVEAAQ